VGRKVAETFYKPLIAILRDHGFVKIPGGKGSHEKWRNETIGRTVTVPKSKSRNTANEVLKQAGIQKHF
jgi:predicted RNA binding protein YcfA (HicA-like mRNA interferase family)